MPRAPRAAPTTDAAATIAAAARAVERDDAPLATTAAAPPQSPPAAAAPRAFRTWWFAALAAAVVTVAAVMLAGSVGSRLATLMAVIRRGAVDGAAAAAASSAMIAVSSAVPIATAASAATVSPAAARPSLAPVDWSADGTDGDASSRRGVPSAEPTAAAAGQASPSAPPPMVSAQTASPLFPTTVRLVREWSHDPGAFTQGFCWREDRERGMSQLYESTGFERHSRVRHVRLWAATRDEAAGTRGHYDVVREVLLSNEAHFGEGITVLRDRVYQLTWQHQVGYIYNAEDLALQRTFPYTTSSGDTHQGTRNNEGWGITHDGTHLIVSDGTSRLFWWDPVTLTEVRRVTVVDQAPVGAWRPYSQVSRGREVDALNEIEYVHGWIFANIWQSRGIAIINPLTGACVHYLDMSVLPWDRQGDVLNGIAYSMATRIADSEVPIPSDHSARNETGAPGWAEEAWGGRLWLTGKYWTTIYELELPRDGLVTEAQWTASGGSRQRRAKAGDGKAKSGAGRGGGGRRA